MMVAAGRPVGFGKGAWMGRDEATGSLAHQAAAWVPAWARQRGLDDAVEPAGPEPAADEAAVEPVAVVDEPAIEPVAVADEPAAVAVVDEAVVEPVVVVDEPVVEPVAVA